MFFNSLGAILHFHATWDELERSGKGWLDFTIRWNRWWLPDVDHVKWLEQQALAHADLRLANRDLAAASGDTASFREYSGVVELHYRLNEAISRVFFPSNATAAVDTSRIDTAGRYS